MRYSFVEAGKYIPVGIDGKLYLDVGNALIKGVIDHHQPSAPKHSATHLVYENAKLLGLDTQEIVLHQSPDLDCAASSYLASRYLQNKELPTFAKELAVFLDKVDFGYAANSALSLHSLYEFIKAECSSDEEALLKGHKLIEEMSATGFESGALPDSLSKYKQTIEDDYDSYRQDYENSIAIACNLPIKNANGFSECKGLVIKKPQSKLFKTWARNDTKHAENGFELLIVQLSDRRTIISVKADGMYFLKGLGDLINESEKKKLREKGIFVDGANRVGYDMPDPWYDGRNPSHNYTIIDSPRRGSELDFEEVLQIVKRYCAHSERMV